MNNQAELEKSLKDLEKRIRKSMAKIQKDAGINQCFQLAVIALIQSHPKDLGPSLKKLLDKIDAQAVNQSTSDAYLQGIQEGTEMLLRVLKK